MTCTLPAEAGFVSCSRCRAASRDWSRSKKGCPKRAAMFKERRARWYANGLCVICGQRPYRTERKTCQPCVDKVCTYQKTRDTVPVKMREIDNLRLETFAAYGAKCQCCGESNPGFLTIDHIDSRGGAHRKNVKNNYQAGGIGFYRWLRANGWPKDNLRLLCFNCNCGRHYRGRGTCPHHLAPGYKMGKFTARP